MTRYVPTKIYLIERRLLMLPMTMELKRVDFESKYLKECCKLHIVDLSILVYQAQHLLLYTNLQI